MRCRVQFHANKEIEGFETEKDGKYYKNIIEIAATGSSEGEILRNCLDQVIEKIKDKPVKIITDPVFEFLEDMDTDNMQTTH